jgi:hypothetical protein
MIAFAQKKITVLAFSLVSLLSFGHTAIIQQLGSTLSQSESAVHQALWELTTIYSGISKENLRDSIYKFDQILEKIEDLSPTLWASRQSLKLRERKEDRRSQLM